MMSAKKRLLPTGRHLRLGVRVTLLSNNLLHLVQALQRMVCDAVSKHDDAECPLQLINGVLLAVMGLHVEVTDLNGMCASFCTGVMGFLSCLLPRTCSLYA